MEFPWEAFFATLKAKQNNRDQALQNAQMIGQNLGDTRKQYQQGQAQTALQQALQAMRGGGTPQPQQGPGLPTPPNTMGATGEQQLPPITPPPQEPDYGNLSMLYGQAFPGQANPYTAGLDPLKQSEIYKNMASGRKDLEKNTENLVDIYRGPNGEFSNVAKPGYTKTGQIPLKEAYQYGMAGQLADKKQGFASAKELTKSWNDLSKAVNPYRSGGMGGGSSVFNKAAVGNQAAARGLKLANKSDLTWKELNAYVNADIASIQRGGGSPTDIQLQDANYTTLKSKLAGLSTYLTSVPATKDSEKVTPEVKSRVKEIINDIISVDNQIIDDGIDFAETQYSDTINAFPKRWERLKNDALKIKTVGQPTLLGGGAGGSSTSGSAPQVGGMFNGQKIVNVTPL